MFKAIISCIGLALAIVLALITFFVAGSKVPLWLLPVALVIVALLFKHPKIRP